MGTFSYQRVNDAEGANGDSFQGDGHVEDAKTPSHQFWNLRSLAVGMILGLVLSLLAFGIIFMEPKDKCVRKISTWSPALEIYDDGELSPQRFNGALRKYNRFRGPPSQDIDDAWEEITYPQGGLVRLSRDQLDRINASEYAAEYTEEMGGGYIAGIEAFHQLHCLNMVRQATYMDYYLPKNKEWEDQETLRYHLDHCIDMLRQKLMCDPDLGMVTYVWAKGYKQPLPDFSTVHKCRPYSKVLDWAHANYVHGSNVADLERAPGALERDTRP
ncbi:hypothetical protein BGW36DRAFT_354739 [Talaromyces proteolyticus]|uniref:Tat pathway signal sequence n=1 Tax=Talaromyces proteolyticus TaxID=1131652 RepID=A0AAD4KXE8_9EURO|nr:uncharacterized protein BGW36DRAFT_354739 [Talaromyces proteolyticus]KAH8703315.1 hypothetical protein BGW36DRAFT_354739 [Talaromyces proteolyticus]